MTIHMKRFIPVLLLLCLPVFTMSKTKDQESKGNVSKQCCPDPCDPCMNPYTGSVTLVGGYFLPLNSRFRDIYTGCAVAGLAFNYKVWRPIYFWTELDGVFGRGQTIGDHNTTRFRMARLDIGFKYVYTYQMNSSAYLFPYLGLAPEVIYFNTQVESDTLIQSQSHWTGGIAVDPGILFKIKEAFAIDIFIKYSWAQHSMHNTRDKPVIINTAHLSGFTFGAGVGYIW